MTPKLEIVNQEASRVASQMSLASRVSQEHVQLKKREQTSVTSISIHKPLTEVKHINRFYGNEPESAKLSHQSSIVHVLQAKKSSLIELPTAQYSPKMVIFSSAMNDDESASGISTKKK